MYAHLERFLKAEGPVVRLEGADGIKGTVTMSKDHVSLPDLRWAMRRALTCSAP